jgi:two-component system response regulator HydG
MTGLVSGNLAGAHFNQRSVQERVVNLNIESDYHNVTICLVDDDPSVLKATGRLLSSAGWKTESFTDPVAFLRYAGEFCPPLVILDILMPMMSGLEVQRCLRSVCPSTRVVVLTSKDDPSIRTKALDAGAAAFFLKPPPDEELLNEIESICRDLRVNA